jgi:hypothetical protein
MAFKRMLRLYVWKCHNETLCFVPHQKKKCSVEIVNVPKINFREGSPEASRAHKSSEGRRSPGAGTFFCIRNH